jgi:hypothetical protein
VAVLQARTDGPLRDVLPPSASCARACCYTQSQLDIIQVIAIFMPLWRTCATPCLQHAKRDDRRSFKLPACTATLPSLCVDSINCSLKSLTGAAYAYAAGTMVLNKHVVRLTSVLQDVNNHWSKQSSKAGPHGHMLGLCGHIGGYLAVNGRSLCLTDGTRAIGPTWPRTLPPTRMPCTTSFFHRIPICRACECHMHT